MYIIDNMKMQFCKNEGWVLQSCVLQYVGEHMA